MVESTTGNRREKRGQTSVELIVSLSFLILTFAILLLLSMEKSNEGSEIKTYLDVKRIGESIKDNINTVSQQGPGYYRYFSIPSMIRGHYDYNVSIYGNTLYVTWDHRLSPWATQLVTSNVSIVDMRKGLVNRNCVMNDKGVIKIKQICGRVSVLVYEGGNGRDKTLLDTVADACMLHVDNTSSADDLTIERLRGYDVLWLGYNSVSGAAYGLNVNAEDAIKQFVQEGGTVWSSAQDDFSWRPDWLPYAVDVGSSGDEDVDATAEAGGLFDRPYDVNPNDLVTDDHYRAWNAQYKVLATQSGNLSKAHFLRLDYGSGRYLLTSIDARDASPEYDGNNTLMFQNALKQLTPYAKC